MEEAGEERSRATMASPSQTSQKAAVLGALGVVYGDIGTSNG